MLGNLSVDSRVRCAGLCAGLLLASAAHAQGLPSLTPEPTTEQKVGPGMNAPPKGPGPVRPFQEEVDARVAIKDAMTKAAAGSKRVLLIWGQNGSSFAPAMKAAIDQLDAQRMIAREYEAVWVNVREGVFAEGNFALTKAYDTKIGQSDSQAVLQVLDETGVPITQVSGSELMDSIRSGQYSPIKVVDWLFNNRRVLEPAERVLEAATARAKTSKRTVFVRFVEFGELWADKFETLLAREDVRTVLGSRFEMVRLDMARNPGAPEVMAKFSARPESYPWYLVLNVDGLPVAMSQPADAGNIGFPTGPEEIEAFVKLVKVGSAPMPISEEEVGILKATLKSMQEKPVSEKATISPGQATKP